MESKKNQRIADERINQLNLLLLRIRINPKEFLHENTKLNLQVINEAFRCWLWHQKAGVRHDTGTAR